MGASPLSTGSRPPPRNILYLTRLMALRTSALVTTRWSVSTRFLGARVSTTHLPGVFLNG